MLQSEGKFNHIEENLAKLEEKVENLQGSFMNKGNVTMDMTVGNSQIQRAVDL